MKVIDRKSLKSSTNDSAVRKEPFGGSEYGVPLLGGASVLRKNVTIPAPRKP